MSILSVEVGAEESGDKKTLAGGLRAADLGNSSSFISCRRAFMLMSTGSIARVMLRALSSGGIRDCTMLPSLSRL